MTTPKHSPTPWTVHRNIGRKSALGIICDAAPCIIATMSNAKEWPVEAKANAEFIVRAVNNHYALVAALKQIAKPALGGKQQQWIAQQALSALAQEGGAK